MSRLTGLSSIFDKILTWLSYITGAIIVFIMLSVTADIILRKGFNSPLNWVDEVTGYLLAYVTFLGSAWMLRKEGHVSVEVVVENLNPRIRGLLDAVTSFLIAVVCLALTYFGVIATWELYKTRTYTVSLLEWPMAPLVAVIPFGCFLLFIQFLRRAYGNLMKVRIAKGTNKVRGEI